VNKSVLIVEDESIVAMEIQSYIEQFGCKVVDTVSNAEDAYKSAVKYRPDLILMDINLKGDSDGIDAALKIRSKIEVKIIYLTAFSDNKTIEKAVATEPSAYLSKPFNRQELFAAIKIALNQYSTDTEIISLNKEFSYNKREKQLFYKDLPVNLTQKESRLFELLISSRNTTLDIYTLENTLWPDKIPNENRRRALISRLRSKLKHQFIETLTGIGYRLNF